MSNQPSQFGDDSDQFNSEPANIDLELLHLLQNYEDLLGAGLDVTPDQWIESHALAETLRGDLSNLYWLHFQRSLGPSTPTQNPPPTLPGYENLVEIGRGGMGVVYKALQLSPSREVAVKMILAGQSASANEIRRFKNEAEAAAKSHHPNIVTIYEVGESNGRNFFSMAYVAGEKSLASMVKENPLAAERAARYVQTIATATHHAHEMGILHRDLKPSNVLIDAFDQPQVTDFGLAKLIETNSDLTLTGDIVGTPSYMSPEQASGYHKQIDRTTDVYSIGAILYELLTGRPPFRAETKQETLRQVSDEEPASPS